jgi:hypothetical protein
MIAKFERLLKTINYGQKLRFLIIKFTNKCNAECDICVERSSMKETELLPLDLIQKAFEEVKDLDIDMGLQGGEVMLYPEYCKEIYDMWRKINKGDSLNHMVTNGFWGENEDTIDYFSNHIKPQLCMITVDKWHQERIPISSINSILNRIGEHPDINFALFQIYSKNSPEKNQEELGIQYPKRLGLLSNPLSIFGKAADLKSQGIDDAPIYRNLVNEELICNNFGLSLNSKGDILTNCARELNGCNFGNIKNINIKDVYEKLRRPIIKYTGQAYTLSDVCKSLEISPLDSKWGLEERLD